MPNVFSIQLVSNATNVGLKIDYDRKYGFELTSLTTTIEGVYKCRAELNGTKQLVTFLVIKSSKYICICIW